MKETTTAKPKSKGLETFWQFVKFIFVSLLAMIVQFALLNILKAIPAIDALRAQDFHWFVFHYLAPKEGLGYFIEFNVANIAAQIVAFFVNREKTDVVAQGAFPFNRVFFFKTFLTVRSVNAFAEILEIFLENGENAVAVSYDFDASVFLVIDGFKESG